MIKTIKLIKEKLDSIPIFFEEEKKYIMNQIDGSSQEMLDIIYNEIIDIENNVRINLKTLQEELKKIEDNAKIELEAKKRKMIKEMIEYAEKRDD